MKRLLLLAVYILLARCQQVPQVLRTPELPQIFTGDFFYLRCSNILSNVKWFFNNVEVKGDAVWKISAAAQRHSGSYRCESNGQKSTDIEITVLEYLPRASLAIQTGHPVMRTGDSVVLRLDHDGGLNGWNCWVYRGNNTKMIKLKLNNDSKTLDFQSRPAGYLETIFWCTDSTQKRRSNQVIVRTSDKYVSLEMYPMPAVAGESLTLKCLVWGTDQITRTVFLKNSAVMRENNVPTYKIDNVTESVQGPYECRATYRYGTAENLHDQLSDPQDLLVQVVSVRAVLSRSTGLMCSCPRCPGQADYQWYKDDEDGQPLPLSDHNHGIMTPNQSGTFRCRAVWDDGRTPLSSRNYYASATPNITLVIVIIVLLILVLVAVMFYVWCKNRNVTVPVYDEVELRSPDRVDDKYQALQYRNEGEYDTIQPVQDGVKKEREYQELRKGEMKEGVYHTLKMEGGAAETGGYEALQRQRGTEEVYHTLQEVGTVSGKESRDEGEEAKNTK